MAYKDAEKQRQSNRRYYYKKKAERLMAEEKVREDLRKLGNEVENLARAFIRITKNITPRKKKYEDIEVDKAQ